MTVAFQFIGFILSFMASNSYSGRYGALAGLGLSFAFACGTLSESEEFRSAWGDYLEIFIICFSLIGYVLFLASSFAFYRVRQAALFTLLPTTVPQR